MPTFLANSLKDKSALPCCLRLEGAPLATPRGRNDLSLLVGSQGNPLRAILKALFRGWRSQKHKIGPL